ncbi:MAG: M81 family metallopeptidase [Alphaproteobacteria bacterium]|nr:M81 family metallopeptidase [Alphaproteobacteria bacterium]
MTAPRVFAAAFGVEVNTFSPFPIDDAAFRDLWLFEEGPPDDAEIPLIAAPLRRLRARARAGEMTLIEGLCAGAQPAGPVAEATYQAMRKTLLTQLRAALPVDVVILGLHGATSSTGCDDVEGDLLGAVRAIAGSGVRISALLDPHAHFTQAMVAAADLLMAYKEYPHDDIFETADSLVDATLMLTPRDELSVAVYDARTLGAFPTYHEPMKSLVADLRQAIKADDSVVDISICHGFPWGDVEEVGAKVWATTRNAPHLARELALKFGGALETVRERAQPAFSALEDVVSEARKQIGCIVIADIADNPGGGAGSDSTWLIQALLNADVGPIACGLIWDPGAYAIARAAGVGARLSMRIGGKSSTVAGAPLDLDARIVEVREGVDMPFGGGLWSTGPIAHIEAHDLHVLITQRRVQCLGIEPFTELGIDLSRMSAVVVKSTNHFEASFRKLSDRIHRVVAPGVLDHDLTRLSYRKVRRPIWPLDTQAPGELLTW